ncbi:MAG: 3-hydroxyacyl-CoA dehydrogenase [Chloroflexi bacterium UTCFX4]|jgi:3-hydroxyacyl-CoA dehydrogenase/enoyl-CoA hydratase/3-hydroxybutyryl-CoA epimerase|nr:MAG: 3-hydroxyacyl-CoA dehydrogenase [Chloroflexi bacterium UTCFX4]
MPIHFSSDEHNIITLTFDHAGAVNLIDETFLREFDEVVARVANDDSARGVILVSAKETFFVGADIEMLYHADDAAQVFEMTQAFKQTLRKLETLGKPVVAALNGSALGGGFEIALACHFRIALDDKKAQFGFPEVTLGVLPAGGGVTRFVRMFGLQTALPYMMEGTRLNVAEAQDAGWIDEIVSSKEEMMERAREWILQNPRAQQAWDADGYRIPGGDPRRPQVMSQLLPIAPAMLTQKTHRNYPAPEAILSAAVEGAMVNFKTATRIESRYFAKLLTSQTAKNMMNAFWFQLNAIKSGASRPKDVPTHKTKKLGVLGAGFMGHGIAYVSALAGMDVVMKDVTRERAEQGKEKIAALLEERVARGKITGDLRLETLARIHATDDVNDLRDCDLIIEAVFEDRAVKADVIRETANVISSDAFFGSNTSTLPISSLQSLFSRPQNFVGIHFFSPVQKMPLIEIIRGKETSDAAIAKAFDYVLQIGKTPIVVNDARGFYTSRVFGTYVSEGMTLLAEGQHPRAIESAGVKAGMAVGPLAVSDEVNIGLIWHIREQTRKDFEAEGKTFPNDASDRVVDFMVNTAKRTGKAQGAGFYEYPENGKKFLWRELQNHFPPSDVELSQQEMIDRLLFVQCLETARCVQQGVLTSSADANIGSIFGWSFAPFSGGTLQFINAYGIEKFIARSRELAQKYGVRFEPPQLLLEIAEQGKSF